MIVITFNRAIFQRLKITMIVRPQQHWLRRIFVWHGSVLSKISSRLLLNFLFSTAVIFMLPWYTHLGIKFTLAPFSILGVAIAIFLGFRNNAGYARYVEGVVCGRGRNPTLRLWPTIFSGKIDVFPGDRRSRLISSMTSVAPA